MNIDPNVKTAVIYSIDELHMYVVNIYLKNKTKNNCNQLSTKFGNLEEVREACKSNGVKKAYLALSKTYEEVDRLSQDHYKMSYDYLDFEL